MAWLQWITPRVRMGLLASDGGGGAQPSAAWLQAALSAAGLQAPAGVCSGLTLLAPTDDALRQADVELPQHDRAALQAWLLRHLTLDDVRTAPVLAMLDGQLLHRESAAGMAWLDAAGQRLRLLGAPTLRQGIQVQAADRVLQPLHATLWDRIQGAPGLHRLTEALGSTGLSAWLGCEGPFTVFAPSDAGLERAAARLGMNPAALWSDRDALTALLSRHLVAGRWPSHLMPWGTSLRTLSGETLACNAFGRLVSGDLRLPLAPGSDRSCRNGVLHRLDEVLLPPSD